MHMKVNLHFQYFLAACECVCVYVLSRLSGEDGNLYANFHASKQCALYPDRSKGMSVCACMFHIGHVCCSIFIFTYQAKRKQITELSRCFINARVFWVVANVTLCSC